MKEIIGVDPEQLVNHKALAIARGAIIEALDHLLINITPENAQLTINTINKYSLLIKDVIVDGEKSLDNLIENE